MNPGPALLRGAMVAVCMGAAALAVRADMPFHIPVYTGTPLMIATGVVTQQTLNRSIAHASRAGSGSGSSKPAAATSVTVGARSDVPAQMAAALPAEARADAQRTYQLMLDKHPQLMRQLGVPPYDVASAMATFVAGVYIAYRDVDFPDRHFQPLYRQLHDIVAAQPAFSRASDAQRRDMYERLAILGTFLALTRDALKQRPDAQVSARLKAAARDYLQQFMQIDAERIQITEQGLRLV